MPTETHPEMTVRKPNFGLNKDSMPVHYYMDNPVITHLLNSFHVVFPAGEKFFIRAVNRYAAQLNDPIMKERVKAFAGQEIQHMAQHQKFYETLRKQGFPVDDFAHEYEESAYKTVEPFVMKLFDHLFGEGKGNAIALSVTAALEHYTATLAEVALNHPELFENLDEDMVHLLKWHAAEEIEHKAVTFDALKAVDDSYAMRAAGMVIGSLALFWYAGLNMAKFIAYDKHINWSEMPAKTAKALPKLAALGWELVATLLPYFKPDFHPDQMDNKELAQQFFKEAEHYFTAKAS